MTCNDCVHSGICAIQLEPHYVLDRAQKLMRESNNVEHECLSFKDRSRFVELPCKIGDVVWFIKGRKNPLVRCGKVKEIILNEFFVYIVRCTCQNFTGVFDVSIFSTQKEAEQALTNKNQPDNIPQ